MKFENCSLYHQGMLGYSKLECKWVEIEIKPYAQYSSAIHVSFLQKGKRKAQGFVQGYKPNVVVAAGHGQASPDDTMIPVSEGDGVNVFKSKYSSCDPGWQNDFVSQVLPKLEVLFDGHGHNSHSQQVA